MPALTFSAVQPEWLLRNGFVAEMLNFNVLAGLDGIQQPLPVLQPCAGDRSVIGPCQQQNAVDVTRQPDQLIAVLIAQRMPENGFQFSGVTGQVDVGETLEVSAILVSPFASRKLRQPRVTRNSVSASLAIAVCGL